MSTEQTLYVVKILLKHISEHPEDARTVASGALSMLDGAPKQDTEHGQEHDKPKTGAPKKAETKSGAPKKTEPKSGASKREPFDVGKLHSLYNGGWSAAMIAEDMGVSEATVYNYAKKEGLKFGSKK